MNFDLEYATILKCVAGSNGYGLATLDSDIDIRGICIPPINMYLSNENFEQYECKDPDVVIYSINKFIKLALKANPNILEILYSDDIIYMDKYGQVLIDIRDEFLTKQAFKSYCGYAIAQVKRIGNKYSKTGDPLYFLNGIENMGIVEFQDNKKDCKHASHVIRLLNTGIEILEGKGLQVKRTDDRKLLMDIKEGRLKYIEFMDIFKDVDKRIKKAYDESKLPDTPNYKFVNNEMIELIRDKHDDTLMDDAIKTVKKRKGGI